VTFNNVKVSDNTSKKNVPLEKKQAVIEAQEATTALVDGADIRDEFYFSDFKIASFPDLDSAFFLGEEDCNYRTIQTSDLALEILPDGYARTYAGFCTSDDEDSTAYKMRTVKL